MPFAPFITISQKIEDKEKQIKLKNIIQNKIPKGSGAILRTAAQNVSKAEIEKDLEDLMKKWEEILKKANNNNDITLLYNRESILNKILKDTLSLNIRKIIIKDKEYVEEVKNIAKNRKFEVILDEDIDNKYALKTQLKELNTNRIWLKCGGAITIDKTEALTSIDVDSKKYTGKNEKEKTVFSVNKEATIEIARQIKLRDIGGIIVIDYIDMTKKVDQEEIKKIWAEEIKKDRAKVQILDFTKLNLLEITRKKMFI